jgi:hypothetical protein
MIFDRSKKMQRGILYPFGLLMIQCVVLFMFAGLQGGAQPIPAVKALSDAAFLDSMGVNSAISKRGENLQNTIQCVKYLGIRWIRAGYESDILVSDLIILHQQTGVHFSYGLMSGGTDLGRLLANGRQLAQAGALLAFEGNNEPNNWGVTYQGAQGGGNADTWAPVANLQRDLYKAVKIDPILKNYPVWNITESGAEKDNVGLQYLTIPQGAGCVMPDGTKYADFANCHNYFTHPSWPGLHDNQTWISSDPTSACRVDGLYGNYGVTWAKHYNGYSTSELLKLPRVTTETGITIDQNVTERMQGLLYMSVYLAQFKRGWSHTSIYLLRDRTDEAGNQTFGFYKPDYTTRLAAEYLHNLTTVLADKESSRKLGSLRYSIPNQPDTVHDLLLQKSSGKYNLVVWDERFTGGEDNVTIKLGNRADTVKVYDPTVGITPIQTIQGASSVSLKLSDHPLILVV